MLKITYGCSIESVIKYRDNIIQEEIDSVVSKTEIKALELRSE